jgi:hypothetical protein
MRSSGPPKSQPTMISRSAVWGRDASAAPISAGPAPGPVSTPTFGLARITFRAGPSSRPWALTMTASSHERPACPKACEIDDMAGTVSAMSPRARSRRLMPKKPGSPEAKITVVSSVWLNSSRTGSIGPRTRRRSNGTPRASRWRSAPATNEAVSTFRMAPSSSGRPYIPITKIIGRLRRRGSLVAAQQPAPSRAFGLTETVEVTRVI